MSRIRELNDALRTTFEGGRVLITAGIGALPPVLACEVVQKVRTFADFTPDNDPYGDHDFGRFEIAGRAFVWKIDYYNKSMTFCSENPADPELTTRVLTIMLAEDY
jgi:hypothetical protein